jgi:FkbM family methyltransferase
VKYVKDVWLPDGESDRVMLAAGASYQASKLRIAMAYVQNRRVAVDVGAHCGLWTLQLLNLFDAVVAFEPLDAHVECWRKNVTDAWATLHQVALGNHRGTVGIAQDASLTGRSHVDGEGSIQLRALDEYNLENVDFLKIDTEGYEYFVVKGAEETIKRCKPVVIVEQKPGFERYGLKPMQAVGHLKSLGYVQKNEVIGDFVMVPA